LILDSSAILAILLAEPGHERLRLAISEADLVAAGAPTLAETAIVLSSRLKRDARPLLNEFLREAEVEVIPFEREHYDLAVDAFQRYGKGRHPAGLNFGDCLTYATARLSGLPLLFAGTDFSQTDLPSVD
jgi:ribonuclease VapC